MLTQASLKIILLWYKCWASSELIAAYIHIFLPCMLNTAGPPAVLFFWLCISLPITWSDILLLPGGCLGVLTKSVSSWCSCTVNSVGRDKETILRWPQRSQKKEYLVTFCSTEFQNTKFVNLRLMLHSSGDEVGYPKIVLYKQWSRDMCRLSYIELLWSLLTLCNLDSQWAGNSVLVCLFSVKESDFHIGLSSALDFPSHRDMNPSLKEQQDRAVL